MYTGTGHIHAGPAPAGPLPLLPAGSGMDGHGVKVSIRGGAVRASAMRGWEGAGIVPYIFFLSAPSAGSARCAGKACWYRCLWVAAALYSLYKA